MHTGNGLVLLTSAGSDANSFLLYPKTKGELEKESIAWSEANPLRKLAIHRPGLLMFEGERKEPRFFEGVAIWLVKTLGIASGNVSIDSVARCMMQSSLSSEKFHIFENDEIKRA